MFAERLAAYAADRCGLAAGARLVVGTSGGVDSTVLFRSLRGLGFDAVAVYVHHGLRDEADDEAAFVVEMAREAGGEALVVHVSVGPGNRQDAARRARYAALGAAARQTGSAVIATGHTATDQAETVLMALVRGAGLRGLAGMDPRRPLVAAEPDGPALVRPLLWATRAEVEADARARGWAWREDASNAGDAYRRNRIRHHVLPLLDAEGGPGTAARIARAADAARAALDGAASASAGARGTLALDALVGFADAARTSLVAEALRAFAPDAPRSQATVAAVAALVSASVGRRVDLGAVTVWRDRDRLRFVRPAPPAEPVPVGPGGAEGPGGRLVRTPLAEVPTAFPASPLAEVVEAEALGGALVLRPWRPGDRITPVGGGGGRRVADVLTDARVPPSERAGRLVLASGGRVVWVVGVRLAEFAAVTPQTRRAERLEWIPAVAGDGPAG